MKHTKVSPKRKRPRATLIAAYLLLAVAGMLTGTGAASVEIPSQRESESSKEVDKKKEVIKEIINALEDVAEDEGKDKKKDVFEGSPEPTVSNDGVSELAIPLPEENPEGGLNKHVLIVDISETIDMGLSAFVIRIIKEHPNASAIIFEINTPGGRVDAATQIRDAIMNLPKNIRSVAFIHPRAISAGAFISFACDYIFISDGGSIGAATPISLNGGEVEAVGEKYVSYFRAEMASTARAKGRNGNIAEAMVDAEVEIDGISPAGKLLTLDTNGALVHNIANAKANSLDEVLKKIALPKAKTIKLTLNWAEKVARVLTDPLLSGILMSIGILGLLIELYQPGVGLPGIVGVVSLLIFFAGHLVVHMAGFEEVVLFVLGVVLLVVEVFVIPGFGIVGILGIVAIIASLVLSLNALPLDVSWNTGGLTNALFRVMASILVTIVMFIIALIFLPRGKFAKSRIVLQSTVSATASGGIEGNIVQEVVASGVKGVADTYLRPAGIARFDGHRVDVITEGEFVDKGEAVEILRTEGNRVVVRKV